MEPVPGTIELRLTESTWLQLDDTGFLQGGGSIIRFERFTRPSRQRHPRGPAHISLGGKLSSRRDES